MEVYDADTLEGAVAIAKAALAGKYDGKAPRYVPDEMLTPLGLKLKRAAESGELEPGLFRCDEDGNLTKIMTMGK